MGLLTKKDFEFDRAAVVREYKEALTGDYGDPDVNELIAHSIATQGSVGEPWAIHFKFPNRCLTCGEKLTKPYVFWHTSSKPAMIGLHIDCAEHFAKGLLEDVARAKK